MTVKPNSLEELWMPFTANKHFKQEPRLFTEAKGVYLTNHRGETLIDGCSGLYCIPAGHGRREITEAIQRIILSEGTALDIAKQAQVEGVRDLRQSGLVKVRAGVTTLEEVITVTNE